MAVTDPYNGFELYKESLRRDLLALCALSTEAQKPLFISAQTGREFFNNDEILQCLAICKEVQEQTGIAIYQETHRNKWAYGAHTVYPILKLVPDLSLTLDLSHWICVSESYLEDQQEMVSLAVERSHHIHARVGYTEGPQVFDPALPEYAEALAVHLQIWDKWITHRLQAGYTTSTITPEFGPPPYMVLAGRSIDPQQEQWGLNLWMKNVLEERYSKIM